MSSGRKLLIKGDLKYLLSYNVTARILPQSKEALLRSFNNRLKEDMDTFTEIIKTTKTEEEKNPRRCLGQPKASKTNMRCTLLQFIAQPSLWTGSWEELTSNLRQFLILNDFPSINKAISQCNQQLYSLQDECDKKLIVLQYEISIDLYELSEEYYTFNYNLCDTNNLLLWEVYWRLWDTVITEANR